MTVLVFILAICQLGPHQVPGASLPLPPLPAQPAGEMEPAAVPSPSLGLADLERLALRNNPTLAQAAERVEQARGQAVQAGLYPNPFLVYDHNSIGADSTVGTPGGFVQQPIVTGGKLRVNRSRYEVDVEIARWGVAEQRLRVLNGVRLRYLQLLGLQQLLGLRGELLRLADEAVRATREKVQSGHASEPDLLMAENQANRAALDLDVLRERYREGWRELAAYLGTPHLPPTALIGDLTRDGPELEWESTLSRLLSESPPVRSAELRVRRQELTLRREEIEPVPDLILRGGSYYSASDGQAVGDARVYLEVPIWNRNQGNIYNARHGLIDVRRDLDRVRLDQQQQLSRAFTRYQNSRARVEIYRDRLIPTARRAFELYLGRFREEEASYSRVSSSLGSYIESSVQYVEALIELRRVEAAIGGLLIVEERIGEGQLRPTTEGLESPPSGGGSPVGRPARSENP